MSGLESTGSTLADLIAAALMALGALLVLLGSIGINRFTHFYSRLHAAGVIDTLASGVFLLGVGVFFGVGLVSIKLLLIFVFLLFTSPTACHALARAAYISGLRHDTPSTDSTSTDSTRTDSTSADSSSLNSAREAMTLDAVTATPSKVERS